MSNCKFKADTVEMAGSHYVRI